MKKRVRQSIFDEIRVEAVRRAYEEEARKEEGFVRHEVQIRDRGRKRLRV